MGAVDVGGPKKSSGGQAWKRPRVAIRIDMTPMVDIAFLLLIFFMVTTVFRLPTAMEMVLPPPNEVAQPGKVFKEKLLQFYVLNNDSLALQIGDTLAKPLMWTDLRDSLKSRYDRYGDSVVVVARVHPKAKFMSLVDLVDEFNLVGTTRFSIDHYTTLDDSMLRAAGFQTAGAEGLPTPEEIEARFAPPGQQL
ncbi:biopolymer transporter ExbD [bacterium]|nr:biopolymer transporter ExbD [bacterium]